jgi:hypothetical protein
MKKWLKILIIIIIIGVFCFVIDVASILIFSKPIFAIKENNGNSANVVYRGLFYDTYNCIDNSMVQIKYKDSKYTCPFELKDIEVIDIVDKTTEIDGFACAQALEKFYEDDNYEYYWSCIKGSYIVVKYSDGSEETVATALKNGKISINDLNDYKIGYYIEKK